MVKAFKTEISMLDHSQSLRIETRVADYVLNEIRKLRADNEHLRREGIAKRETARQVLIAGRKKKGGR